MITIERTVEIPADRRLVLDLPQNVPGGRVNIVLVVSRDEMPSETSVEAAAGTSDDALWHILSRRFPTIEEIKAEAAKKTAARRANPQGDPLTRYAGCLKDSRVFEGDPVLIQRKMRDEWD